MNTELMFVWTAEVLYCISALVYIFGTIARSEKLFLVGLYTTLAGFIPHVVSIALRWIQTGITPFIAISESITFAMGITVLIFLIVQFSSKRVMPLGVLIIPIVFILMGWAITLRKDAANQLAPALQSGWIWVHIIGAASGFACVLTAAGLSLLYLMREKKVSWLSERLPESKSLDMHSYRFIAGGFIMYTLMIVSGSFWADQVKGSYWNWDPVEVWSLISWLTYGIYLHLRITFGWKGERLAWYALIAAAFMIVSYWGIPFVVDTFHSGFRIEH